jgi:hypothetical protein
VGRGTPPAGEGPRAGAHRLAGPDTVVFRRLRLPGRLGLSGRLGAWLFYPSAALVLVAVALIGLAIAHHDGSRPVDRPGVGAPVGDNPRPALLDPASGTGSPSPSGIVSPSPSRSPSRSPSPSASAGNPSVSPSPSMTGATSPSPSTSPTPVWTSLTVTATRVLARGASVSTNRTQLLMRTDGNLVIIDEHGTTRWTSGTAGSGYQATFQGDGNFVVYNAQNSPLWSSRTDRHNGAVLVLETNGDVCVVYQSTSIWCAGTAH